MFYIDFNTVGSKKWLWRGRHCCNLQYNPNINNHCFVLKLYKTIVSFLVFHIRFPCTKKKSGVVDMKIVFNFYTDEKRKNFVKTVDLSMKRQCTIGMS